MKKNKINWLYLSILLIVLLIGFFAGLSIGIKTGQMILFEGVAVALKDSNMNITIDLNETEIIKGINETIVPVLKEMFIE